MLDDRLEFFFLRLLERRVVRVFINILLDRLQFL